MRHDLLRSVGCAALLFAATTASAQTVEPETTTVDEIVVTGIRQSNARAIASKLSSTGITDVVSTDEVQALPDLTIVEALRRVPGLSVLPATDNEHPRDEAATPVLRGLGAAYNNVTIDGMPVASPGTPNANLGSIGRGVRLDILPSSMISELKVIKTFTADLDPNAIGGAIDLQTRSAFERGGDRFFTLDAAMGAADDYGKPVDQDQLGTRLTATGSLTFGPDDMFGLVISANYQKLESYTETHMTTDTVHYGFYDAAGVLQSGVNLGNGFAVPQQDKYWYVEDSRERFGLTTKLEAHLNEGVYGYATVGYYKFRDTMERYELLIDPRNRGRVFNQTATSGTYPTGDIEVGYSIQDMTNTTKLFQSGLDWTIDDNQTLTARLSLSRATYREPIQMVKFATGITRNAPGSAGVTINPTAAYGFNYDTSQLDPRFAVAPSAFYDLNAYTGLYYRPDYKRSASNEVYSARSDYGFNMDVDDSGFGLSAGLGYTENRPEYEVHRTEYQPNNTLVGGLTLATVAGPAGAPLNYSNGLNLLTIDARRAFAEFNALPRSAFNQTDQSAFNNQDNFDQVEKVWDGYALTRFRNDRLDAQVGLHYDSADIDTRNRARVNGAFRDMTSEASYDFLLPSAVLTYKITPSLDVRFGASQTIGRPSYDSYAARTSINFLNAIDQGNGAATGVTVGIGNPDIKPRLSTNLDANINWSLSNRYGGLLSLAVFDKDIKDEIFNSSSIGYAYDGVTYVNAVVSKPSNAASASIRGIELNAVLNSLEFVHPLLRDFGVSGNVSVLEGEIEVLQSGNRSRTVDHLVGQSDVLQNYSAFYNHGGFELRVAYNKQGEALRAIVPEIAWQDLYWAPREQVDVQASYRVRDDLTVYGQVSNVTQSRLTSLTGPNKDLLKDSYSVPTTIWVGLRFTPQF